ncbi:alpha/beta fold hydrolase [Nocardia sp. CA-119907]|uniref:alpha/beta fold hydrolase n=1 Tax=Nocardia sp. CA-119907 TaxID=3239973 RepID=UPI003D98FB12
MSTHHRIDPIGSPHIDDSILEIVPNCGHTSTLEQPEAITDLLVAFPTSLDRAATPPHGT